MASSIQSLVEALATDQNRTPEERRKILLELAGMLVSANADVKRKAVELDLACEKKSTESQKSTLYS